MDVALAPAARKERLGFIKLDGGVTTGHKGLVERVAARGTRSLEYMDLLLLIREALKDPSLSQGRPIRVRNDCT